VNIASLKPWLGVVIAFAVIGRLSASHAEEPPPVPVRGAAHPGFTRLVFDYPRPTEAAFLRHGADITLRFSTPGPIAPVPGAGIATLPGIRGVAFGNATVTFSLAPGVAAHSFRLGNRRVLDLLEPIARSIGPAALPPLAPVRVSVAPPTAVATVTAEPSFVSASASSALPVVRAGELQSAPAAPARALQALADDQAGAVTLSFPAGTGAAALQRGPLATVVFDAPRAIDQASLRARAGFETASVQQLPQAVVIRLQPPRDRTLVVTQIGTDWSIALVPQGAPLLTPPAPIAVQADTGRLHLAAPPGGIVVAVPDPQTGENLLIGTVPTAGHAEPSGRRFAQFTLLPSLLGVAVDPLSDQVAVRPTPDGFIVESGQLNGTLSLSLSPPLAATASNQVSRSFDLPDQPPGALLRRLQLQIADAAAAPVLARLPARRAVAQTMLALGLGPEAQGVMHIASSDDPRALSDPAAQALAGAAALIAGRLDQTDPLSAADAGETTEHRLWRALRDAARLPDGALPDPPTTQAVAAGVDLLLSYPPTLQRLLLPLAADTLLRGGALAAADRLLAGRSADPTLALARAAALQAHGQNDLALAAYDRLTDQPDRSVRARAAVAALDLRVQTGRLSPAAAADAADKLLDAWRGDARERDLRLRIADWRGRAGQYRQQLETLRDALAVFPQPQDGLQQKLTDAFGAVVRAPVGTGADALAPLDLVSLVQGNLDLLPPGDEGRAMLDRLADRLAALDLPQQAEAVLAKLIGGATAPAIRAGFGARLAAIDLQENQAAAALDALQRSGTVAPLPPDLTSQRNLLAARAHAALGDVPAALASLPDTSSAPAALERAQVNAQAHNWQQAAADLSSYAETSLPPSGPLNATQSGAVLQWASALAQAGDQTGLATLRNRFTGRLSNPNDAILLAVLTESPVLSVADLSRATIETKAARALPTALQAAHPAE
jgi:hypothetical protein